MELTFWDRIVRAFQYDLAIWHNVFLTIIYIIAGACVFFAIRYIRTLIRKKERFSITAFFTILIGPLVFPVVLFLILSLSLGGSSSVTPGQKFVTFKTSNGDEAVALTTGNFLANETGRYGTYGSTRYYAVALSQESGKKVWQTKLSGGEAELLGKTGDKLWYFTGNGLQVIALKTGKTLAKASDFKGIQNQFPKNYENYLVKDQLVYFKGLDGQFYQINPKNLTGKVTKEGIRAADFPETPVSGEKFETAQITATPNNDQLFALLSDKELQAIQAGSDIEMDQENERSYLYQTKLVKQNKVAVSDNEKVMSEAFISGEFILDPSRKRPTNDAFHTLTDFTSQVSDTENSAYSTEYNRFVRITGGLGVATSSKYLPLATSEGNWLILHYETIERNSSLKLSAFNPRTKQVSWTTLLYTSSISSTLKQGDKLTLLSNDDLLEINLKNGNLKGYSFQNDRFFSKKPE
ncbi:PA2928 family protein [Listeria aquatica]|uniref:PA2928 family protein n=1 Tax=Listeria aquatica TaxID=1494960 RepID=UPI003F6EF00E